jgi:hypothetical protein
MMQILQMMRDYLVTTDRVAIYKSDLKERGIDPRTAENYFRVIAFCQSKVPRLSISEDKDRFVVTLDCDSAC